MSEATPWWRGAVLYQIYVRSFADGNGDGIGDFPGLLSRLDYVAALGVDAVWLSPIHPTPNRDWGYDVSDYDRINPEFGNDTDFERLLAESHARGLKLLIDEVLAHTSDELPYTTAVAVDRWEEDEEKNLIRIYATIVVERETQKPIIIGKRGEMIKRIGTEARVELEAILGARVFLDLHVAVHGSWREDERFLGELDWPLS